MGASGGEGRPVLEISRVVRLSSALTLVSVARRDYKNSNTLAQL